jgi:hypothetical protein
MYSRKNKYLFFQNIKNANDIVECMTRRQKIVNDQRSMLNLPKIHFFIKKLPDSSLTSKMHHLLVVPGILSYLNFNTLDSVLKTRIYSDNHKFQQVLEGKISSKCVEPPSKVIPLIIENEKTISSIRKKRLFIKMKERIANDVLTPESGFYFKQDNPNLNLVPEFCNKKALCSNCESICAFTAEEIGILPLASLKKELKTHLHPQNRKSILTKKSITVGEVREELLSHYRFIHQNFGEIIKKKKDTFCVCKEKDIKKNSAPMIMCELGENCQGEWFHLTCMEHLQHPLPKNLDDEGNYFVIE